MNEVEMEQEEYSKTLRAIVPSQVTGAAPEKQATKLVSDFFVSLRGALAFTSLTQLWILVCIVSLKRVQQPTNLDVCGFFLSFLLAWLLPHFLSPCVHVPSRKVQKYL